MNETSRRVSSLQLRFLSIIVLLSLIIIQYFTSIARASGPPILQSLRVVTDNNYPPYVFLDNNGIAQGILVDQWRLWQKKTGIQVEIVAIDWEDAQKRMKAGEFDVIDTVFKNEARTSWLDFGKPYTKIEVPAFFKNQIGGITDIDSLKGFVVAVKEGQNS